MIKRCLLSYANGIYKTGLRRLEESVRRTGFDGDILFWYDDLPPGSPEHDASPCAFKIFAFLEAKRRGYDQALWIDATGIVVRSPSPIFDQIGKDGYFLLGLFCASVGEWSADATLRNFGITREEAMRIPELLTFAIGLDLNDPLALQFLEEYRQKAVDGISFRGAALPVPLADTLNNKDGAISTDTRVRGHRWEQTNASLIAWKLGMRHSIYGSYDIIGHASGGRPYVRIIPADTILVQNRDIRGGNPLVSLDRWSNGKGIFWKAPYFVAAVALAAGRRIRTYLKIKKAGQFDASFVKTFK